MLGEMNYRNRILSRDHPQFAVRRSHEMFTIQIYLSDG